MLWLLDREFCSLPRHDDEDEAEDEDEASFLLILEIMVYERMGRIEGVRLRSS